MESLQELVLRKAREIGGREGVLSTRQLEAAAGGAPTRGVFQAIMAGTYKARPSVETIEGIARAIQEPVAAVERAAGAPPSYGPFDLGKDAQRLTPKQRVAVMSVVTAMLEPDVPAARPLRAVASRRSGKAGEAAEEARSKARKAREDG